MRATTHCGSGSADARSSGVIVSASLGPVAQVGEPSVLDRGDADRNLPGPLFARRTTVAVIDSASALLSRWSGSRAPKMRLLEGAR
jgi:hypothetical protein